MLGTNHHRRRLPRGRRVSREIGASRTNIRRKSLNLAFLGSDYKLLLLLIFTVTGILAGAFLVRGIGGDRAQVGGAFTAFLERRAGQRFQDIFLDGRAEEISNEMMNRIKTYYDYK